MTPGHAEPLWAGSGNNDTLPHFRLAAPLEPACYPDCAPASLFCTHIGLVILGLWEGRDNGDRVRAARHPDSSARERALRQLGPSHPLWGNLRQADGFSWSADCGQDLLGDIMEGREAVEREAGAGQVLAVGLLGRPTQLGNPRDETGLLPMVLHGAPREGGLVLVVHDDSLCWGLISTPSGLRRVRDAVFHISGPQGREAR
jgi:hypothetical protein